MEAIVRIAPSRDHAERELAGWHSDRHGDVQRELPSTRFFTFTGDGQYPDDEYSHSYCVSVATHDYDDEFVEWNRRKRLLVRCRSFRRNDAVYMECNWASAGCEPQQQHRSAQRYADEFRFLQSELAGQGLERPDPYGDVYYKHFGGGGSSTSTQGHDE